MNGQLSLHDVKKIKVGKISASRFVSSTGDRVEYKTQKITIRSERGDVFEVTCFLSGDRILGVDDVE